MLALDYGAARIGMAVSDESGTFAFPAGVLDSRGPERDLAHLPLGDQLAQGRHKFQVTDVSKALLRARGMREQ